MTTATTWGTQQGLIQMQSQGQGKLQIHKTVTNTDTNIDINMNKYKYSTCHTCTHEMYFHSMLLYTSEGNIVLFDLGF